MRAPALVPLGFTLLAVFHALVARLNLVDLGRAVPGALFAAAALACGLVAFDARSRPPRRARVALAFAALAVTHGVGLLGAIGASAWTPGRVSSLAVALGAVWGAVAAWRAGGAGARGAAAVAAAGIGVMLASAFARNGDLQVAGRFAMGVAGFACLAAQPLRLGDAEPAAPRAA